jgi:hypothetical protein
MLAIREYIEEKSEFRISKRHFEEVIKFLSEPK